METINYKGCTIEVHQDTDGLNPFEEWDGNLPLIRSYSRDYKDYSNGDINQYLSEVLSNSQIIRHQKKIATAFEMELEDYAEYNKHEKIDAIRDEILNNTDFEALETICILSKTPYLNTNSKGYSQGDYADIFTCYTEKFETETGCKKRISTIGNYRLMSICGAIGHGVTFTDIV